MHSLPDSVTMATPTMIMTSLRPAVEQCQTEQGCTLFTVVVYVFIQGTMFALGFVGNTLSFIVLQSDRKSHAATFLLQAMAVIDNLFLLSAGFSQTFTAVTLFADQPNHWLSIYLQVLVWPLIHITQLCTVWITVLTAFNRFVAICYPYDADRVCSLSRVKLQVIAMVLIVILYNSPRFFEFSFQCTEVVFDSAAPVSDGELSDNSTSTLAPTASSSTLNGTAASSTAASSTGCVRVDCETSLKKASWYLIGYENVLYCLVVFLIPLILLVVFNVALVVELFRSHREHGGGGGGGRPSANSENDERNNITLVMMVIIVVFLVTQTPAYLNQLLYYFLAEEEYQCGHLYFYYYHVSNLIVSSNSCLNFVVYCICRQKFRDRLSELRCCVGNSWCSRQRGDVTSMTTRPPGTNSCPVTCTASIKSPNGVPPCAV